MEHDKARTVLADHRQAVVDAGSKRWLSPQRSEAVAALNRKLGAVNRVLRELVPDLPLIAATNLTQHRSARIVLDQAEAVLLMSRNCAAGRAWNGHVDVRARAR